MKTLTPVMKKFILHWGEMGPRWGVNRTVAQIHALLFAWGEPLTAEDISKTLSVARSNVSNSLKELLSWGIIKVVQKIGDRRDHFEALPDVWETFQLILAERKKREVDPTVKMLRECVDGLGKGEEPLKKRLQDLREYFEAGTACLGEVGRLSPSSLRRVGNMSGKLARLLAGE